MVLQNWFGDIKGRGKREYDLISRGCENECAGKYWNFGTD